MPYTHENTSSTITDKNTTTSPGLISIATENMTWQDKKKKKGGTNAHHVHDAWCNPISKGSVLTAVSVLPNQTRDLNNTALQTCCWGGAKGRGGAPVIDVIKLILALQGALRAVPEKTCAVSPVMNVAQAWCTRAGGRREPS